jgi:peptidoglycan glycosyltransferase
MNRIATRSWIVIVLAGALLLGLMFFVGDYLIHAGQWVQSTGSPHIYKGNQLQKGSVVDRSGVMLLDYGEQRTYAEQSPVRKATLHWVGDRAGNIRPPLISEYTLQLCGYNPMDGVYAYGDNSGTMELTLSAQLQTVAMEAMGKRRGVVAVMNYRTGEILCAVSTPTFDPDNVPDIAGDTTGKYNGVYLNRFIQSAYTPGSIFKLVTTAAALESVPGITERTFYCAGEIPMEGSKVVCAGVHGSQTLEQALANSCNCAFAEIAELVGRERLEHYVQKFGVTESLRFDGFTTRTGNFDVTGEDRISLCWSGIGQHKDVVNPCTYLNFVAAIASEGSGVQPYVVQSVSFGSGTTYQARTVGENPIMSYQTAQTLKELMRNNVVTKYGDKNFSGLEVCAKSGTAEIGNGKSNALFTGFVDSERYPLAFIVVIEEGGTGSAACVPVISKVLSAWVEILDGL